jgi:VWFA-related protein
MREYARDEMDALQEFPECEDDRGYDLQNDFKKLVGQLNRYNITFYTVSSRGPINDLLETVRETDRSFHINDLAFLKDYEDFIALMADETGGLYFGNSLNFKRGFDAIQADLNHQYLLCYQPPPHTKQGHHSIKVKTKKNGLKIRHRSGYFD